MADVSTPARTPVRKIRRNPGPRRRPPTGDPAAKLPVEEGSPHVAQGADPDASPGGERGCKIRRTGERGDPCVPCDGGPLLLQIPQELCLDILRFLSPEDLASCSRSCTFLKPTADDERLWRRAYCLRWGRRPEEQEDHMKKGGRKLTWKQAYFKRDGVDMEKFLRGVSADMRPFYMQMQTAKRSTPPTTEQACALSLRGEKTLGEQISEWRRSRNLTDPDSEAPLTPLTPSTPTPTAAPEATLMEAAGADAISTPERPQVNTPETRGTVNEGDAAGGAGCAATPLPSTSGRVRHVCSGQHCTYHKIGEVFLCELTGQAHLCGDNCDATVVDPRSELLVCAVSGRCFDRMIDEREDEEGEEVGAMNDDDVARLGAAFALGYGCENEAALEWVQRSLGAS